MPRRKVASPLRVVYEPDDGAWYVHIPSVQGCLSHGRSLSEARRHIREALAAALDDEVAAETALFEEEYRGVPAAEEAAEVRGKRAVARSVVAEVDKDTSVVARKLLGAGLSLRDAAELLGVSHVHVKKLAEDKLRPAKARTAGARQHDRRA